jgi:hypothetical protein
MSNENVVVPIRSVFGAVHLLYILRNQDDDSLLGSLEISSYSNTIAIWILRNEPQQAMFASVPLDGDFVTAVKDKIPELMSSVGFRLAA